MEPTKPTYAEKNHWYDGTFFDLCIAPNQDPIFAAIRAAISRGSTVLDVGCGTGRLVFQLADHCRMVWGIDPSKRNIRRAKALHTRGRGIYPNIHFESTSLEAYVSLPHQRVDVGVLSYVLHEVSEGSRIDMLRLLAGSVQRIILADYMVPRVGGMMGAATHVVEFLAGREHYRGFRSFIQNGGLTGLVRDAGLELLAEHQCSQAGTQILGVLGAQR